MFKNKKIVLFLLVLPLVAVLVAPKVALADDDSDWVKNIPIIGGVVDFASDPGGWITDRFAEGAEFFFNDGLQNIKTTSTKSILGKSFNNLLGKKTGTFYSTVSFVNKSVVMPTAASILSLVMLIQLIKISQRIDGTATLPAIKDIVFLIIYATIFIWLLKNSLKICAGAYDLFNEMIGKINQSTVDELKTVTIADSCKESFGAVIGIWVQSMIFDLITIIIKGSVSVMCYMRAMQLYVMAAFSPLPFSQLHDSAVVEDSRGKKHTAPGKLLDLAGLSAILAKQGFKPANVLKTYQEMYENQIVSYPRTEDKEVTPEQFGELLPLVDKIASVVGVDTSLLSHRAARKTHVKEGGAHGANRPGINVPESLAELENGYGKIGSAIYSVLAKNYLAMLAEDYEYELIKGHVRDFPEYVGQTQIPIKPGFKAIFDSDSSSTEKSEGEEAENACEFGKVASPYVHEGANKRPQKPTMKWLTKKLEKYNVGTGATRTSTLAEITANEERALMKENKGALTMTKCGEVSYALLANCQIASPEVTEKLFESMNEVGRFSRKPSDVINTVTDMVVHDMRAMQDNIGALDGMKLGDGNAIVIGKCPKCGKDLYATKNQFRCAGVHFKKTGEKDGKSVFAHVGTCDFFIYRFVGPKDKPKKLTDKNGREIAEKGKTSLIKGIKKKSGDGTYDAYLTLNRETWSLDMQFPEFKGKKHKG